LDELTERNADYIGQLAKLSKTVEELVEENHTSIEKIGQMEHELAQRDEAISELERDNAEQRSASETKAREIAVFSKRLEDFQSENGGLQSTVQDLRATNADCAREREDLQASLREMVDLNVKLEAQVEDLIEAKKALEAARLPIEEKNAKEEGATVVAAALDEPAEEERKQVAAHDELGSDVATQDVTEAHENLGPDEEWLACMDYKRIEEDYLLLTQFRSHYQEFIYHYDKEKDDVCLYMDNWLHSCASYRPHLHEMFVHYAARYVDKVERVIFFGGGDSQVLHEVMKYDSLELVVGLELDQEVARSSFYHFGSQPHFDNDKVEWYFGDAAKSLSALPKDYYGSFDLVILDIESKVASALKVHEELTLLDAAMLLMKPDGILVKNEDEQYKPGSPKHTNYAVDLVFHDVPQYCLQVVVLASNSVDFLTAKPVDHGVETLYLKGVDEFQAQFDSWYNFGVADSQHSWKCGGNMVSKDTDSTFSVLMILEAEQSSIPLESLEDIILKALARVGLTKVDSLASPLTMDDIDGSTIMVLADEGYITARCVPDLEYCAFDILLYGSSIANMADIKEGLLQAVQSPQSSSYRFVLGGMIEYGNGDEKAIGPPTSEDFCSADSDGNQESSPARKVRVEKKPEEFGSPQPATMHSYNNTLALNQWKSQILLGGQILMQFEVAPFWAGEEVFILNNGEWHHGQIEKVRVNNEYDVVYKSDNHMREENVGDLRIKKSSDQVDKALVEASLVSIITQMWELADQDMNMGRVNNGVGILRDSSGHGLTLAASWEEGTMVISWDGKSKVTVNFFLSPSNYGDMAGLVDDVMQDSDVAMLIAAVSVEVFPRGTSSVILFSEEVDDKLPIWA
jgi:spermidine synthase